MTLRYRSALLVVTGALVAALVISGLEVAIPKPPPASVESRPATHQPLTNHLALIIVDGLRYDIGTDKAAMPHFAEAMRTRTSGEIWAGAVTMTTGAVLAIASGQYGDLDQIVFNETAHRTEFDHWLGRAADAGLVMAATGDGAWFRTFGNVWDLAHEDPPGVSMETDYNDEIFDAAMRFVAHQPRPNVLFAHFVTPDHQGHVHGVLSDEYRAHVREFDGKLHRMLQALPADMTVFVTSDHGALDGGSHGSDSPVQRRCPIFAYGPGIRDGFHDTQRLGQADLAATFAYLLRLPSPAHSLGHVLARWLDLPAEQQAAMACDELARIQRLADATTGSRQASKRVVGDVCQHPAAEARLTGSRAASGRVAELIEESEPTESEHMWLMLGGSAMGALLLALLWLGRAPLSRLREWRYALLAAVALLCVGVALTREVEKLPGVWPNVVRVALFVSVNTALLAATIWVRAFARFMDRHAPLVATAVVGALVVSYSANTQAQSYVFAALCLLVMLVPILRRHLAPSLAGIAGVPWYRAGLALILMVLIHPMGFTKRGLLPSELSQSPELLRWLATSLVLLFAVERASRRPDEIRTWAQRLLLVLLAALAAAGPWLHGALSPAQTMVVWLVPPLVGLWLWLSGRRTAAELVWLLSYAMVARHAEYLFLLPTVFIAATVGEAVGKLAHGAEGEPRHAAIVGIVLFLFTLTYTQRIGIQLGMDFTSMDWTAGTFGGENVSLWRIGSAIVYKHSFARAALVFVVLLALPIAYRRKVAYGLLLAELGRTVALMAMLLFCRRSFWTSLRTMSDLPHALMAVMVAAVACAIVLGPRVRGSAKQLQPARAG